MRHDQYALSKQGKHASVQKRNMPTQIGKVFGDPRCTSRGCLGIAGERPGRSAQTIAHHLLLVNPANMANMDFNLESIFSFLDGNLERANEIITNQRWDAQPFDLQGGVGDIDDDVAMLDFEALSSAPLPAQVNIPVPTPAPQKATPDSVPFRVEVAMRKTAKSPFEPCLQTAEELFSSGVHSKTIRVRVFVDASVNDTLHISASTKRPTGFTGNLSFLLLSTDANHNKEGSHFGEHYVHTSKLENHCFTFFVRPIYKSCPNAVKPTVNLHISLLDEQRNKIVGTKIPGWVRSRLRRA